MSGVIEIADETVEGGDPPLGSPQIFSAFPLSFLIVNRLPGRLKASYPGRAPHAGPPGRLPCGKTEISTNFSAHPR